MTEDPRATRKPPSKSNDVEKPTRRPEPRKSAEGRPQGSGTVSGSGGSRPPHTSAVRDDTGDGAAERGETKHHPVRGGTGISAMTAAQIAISQLTMLMNRVAEGVVAIRKNDSGGWTVVVEVVESPHIPDTSDLLAEYEVVLDSAGELVSYSRGSRYVRGRPRGD